MVKEDLHFKSLEEFWPFYLSQHSRPWTKRLHIVGIVGGLALLFGGIWTGSWTFVVYGLLSGYGFAWAGHFFIEKNKPATFSYPFYSFVCDFKMIYFILSGKI